MCIRLNINVQSNNIKEKFLLVAWEVNKARRIIA